MTVRDSRRTSLETRLTHESYQVIEREIRSLPSDDLLQLLDSRSRKIGDSAADLILERHETDILVEALLHDRIRSVLGRVRATNVLADHGRSAPGAIDAYVHCLDDRSDDVLSNALFGIVFMRRRDLIPMLRQRLAAAETNAERHKMLREAVEALEADDPQRFSPGFRDAQNVWGLEDLAG
jgi:hypothetical protein